MLRLLSVTQHISQTADKLSGVRILKLGYKIKLWLINWFGVNKKVNILININFDI